MPRPSRGNQPSAVYHLIPRFVGQEWFIPTDEERMQYLRLLGIGLRGADWRCLTYGVMSNHIHLGVIAGRQPLASWIREPHSLFADWINHRRKRVGAVFVRGPKQYAVRPGAVGKLIAYVHNNPVRAGVAARAASSTWTSHRAYLGLSPCPDWLDVQSGMERAGFDDASSLDAWVNLTPIQRADFEIEQRRRGRQAAAKGSDPFGPMLP